MFQFSQEKKSPKNIKFSSFTYVSILQKAKQESYYHHILLLQRMRDNLSTANI